MSIDVNLSASAHRDCFDRVCNILKSLHLQGVVFLVLRYSERYSSLENEIDILVPARKSKDFISAFLKEIPSEISCLSASSFLLHSQIVLLGSGKGGVSIDIREAIVKSGAVLANYASVIKDRPPITSSGFPQPSLEDEASLLIARNLWSSRKYKKRHRDILDRCWSDGVLDALPKYLTSSSGADCETAIGNATRQSVPLSRKRFGIFGRLKLLFQHFKFGFKNRYNRKRPLVVAIYGPDGVGKTTGAHLLGVGLKAAGLSVEVNHYSSGKIDDQYMNQEREKSKKLRSTKKPEQEISAKLLKEDGSILLQVYRLLLFPIKVFLMYLKVRKKKKLDVVVFDRYAFDFLVKGESQLINYQVRRFVAKMYGFFSRKSNCINIILEASPTVILERKAELAHEDIEEYYHCVRVCFGANAQWVDASQSEDEVSKAVIEKVIQKIASTYNRG